MCSSASDDMDMADVDLVGSLNNVISRLSDDSCIQYVLICILRYAHEDVNLHYESLQTYEFTTRVYLRAYEVYKTSKDLAFVAYTWRVADSALSCSWCFRFLPAWEVLSAHWFCLISSPL
jgi:hypothetical protein